MEKRYFKEIFIRSWNDELDCSKIYFEKFSSNLFKTHFWLLCYETFIKMLTFMLFFIYCYINVFLSYEIQNIFSTDYEVEYIDLKPR